MRKLLVAAALLCASCATPSLRAERVQEGQPRLRVLVLQRAVPSMPPLGIGTEMALAGEEVGVRAVPDLSPLVWRRLEPVALPSFEPVFTSERRAAFVPAVEARVQAALHVE